MDSHMHEGPYDVVPAIYNDARRPVDLSVMIRIEGRELVIASEDGVTLARWPLDVLRVAGPGQQGELRLCPGRRSLERLTICDEAFIAQLRAMLPWLREERVFELRRVRFVLTLMIAMVFVLGAVFFVAVPYSSEYLARVVPGSWRADIGETVRDAVIEEVARRKGRRAEDLVCRGEVGMRALSNMVARLSPHVDVGAPVSVTVIDHDDISAFAVPGGHIVVFRGLLKFARTADELAGVLAHELAHAEGRHPSRKIFEGGTTRVLLSLLFGDFGGRELAQNLGVLLINARYSRDMESSADKVAVRIMDDAGIDPGALARFLERVHLADNGIGSRFAWMLSHPAADDRARAVRDVADQKLRKAGAKRMKGKGFSDTEMLKAELDSRSPVLSQAEFIRLRLVCADQEQRFDRRLPQREP